MASKREFRTRLGVESLESRLTPTGGASLVQVSLTGGVLYIAGTSQNDVVEVDDVTGQIVVHIQGQSDRTFADSRVRGVVFSGRDGDDSFTNNTALTCVAFGGNGNDTLIGGTLRDYLFGGAGDDRLVGNGGNNYLIGGQRKDTMRRA